MATAAMLGTVTVPADADTTPQAATHPTPDPCARAPASVAAQQAAFTVLAAFGSGWSTADGYVPVPLPGGRTAWLMSDTLLAPPSVDPAAAGPAFVHNSTVVQHGRCFTPMMGGNAEVRADLIPPVDGRACWQSAGVAHGTTLAVFCTEVQSTDGPPGFGFRVTGTALATFTLPGFTFTGRAPLPFTDPARIRWGTGAVLDHDWVYVYGAATDAQYVARVRFDQLTTGPWHFWTGGSWGARDALVPMRFRDATPAMPAFVTPTADGFVAVAFAAPFPDPHIGGWTATTPQGPWRPIGTVATATTSPGQFAYDPRAVDLGRAGWALVYNVNDPIAVASDPTAYGARFLPFRGGVRRRRPR